MAPRVLPHAQGASTDSAARAAVFATLLPDAEEAFGLAMDAAEDELVFSRQDKPTRADMLCCLAADLLRQAGGGTTTTTTTTASTNAESQAPLPKSLQALLALAEKALQPVRDARSQAEAESDKHAAKLPDALKSFVPLASEPEIKSASEGLHEHELAVAQSPTSAAANEALQAKLDVLGECTRATAARA